MRYGASDTYHVVGGLGAPDGDVRPGLYDSADLSIQNTLEVVESPRGGRMIGVFCKVGRVDAGDDRGGGGGAGLQTQL